MTSRLAPATATRNAGGVLAWHTGLLLLVTALLLTLAARYLFHEAFPFLIDISQGQFGRFWPRRFWLLTYVAGSALPLLATEVILQGER